MVEIGRTELRLDGLGDLVGVDVREKIERNEFGVSAQLGMQREEFCEHKVALTALELVECRGRQRFVRGHDSQLQFAGRRAGNGGRHSQVRYAA